MIFPFGSIVSTAIASPEMVTRPSIDNNNPSGTGVLLTATPGTYTNTPASYVREWRRNGVAIGGATGLTYTTATADKGKRLSFYEKAVNTGGDSGFIRAETGLPTLIFCEGDSTTNAPFNDVEANAWPAKLGAFLGSGFRVDNQALSGRTVADCVTNSVANIFPRVDPDGSVYIGVEIANNVIGVQGSHTGADTYAALRDNMYLPAKATGMIVVAETDYHIATEAQVASDLIRANYLTFATGLAELHTSTLISNVAGTDNVHPDIDGHAEIAVIMYDLIVSMGIPENVCGIDVPPATISTLKTYAAGGYYYDIVTPLPLKAEVNVGSTTLTVVGGSGWTPGTRTVTAVLEKFSTVDGYVTLWQLSSSPEAGGTTSGQYTYNL